MNDASEVSVDRSSSLDPVLVLWGEWQQAQHVSLVLCRMQQRLETRMMVDTGIQVLTAGESSPRRISVAAAAAGSQYAMTCEAEVLAMTEALKLQDTIPEVPSASLLGIVAKLEMIVGADRDIGDPTDFPWPHIASVLRDLKAIAGDLPVGRRSRERTRSDVAKHWESAVKLVAALEEEGAVEHRREVAGL